MEKFTKFLEKYLEPVAEWISNNRFLKSISNGMIMLMPFLLVTALFSIVQGVPAWLDFIPDWSEGVSNILLLPYNVTFGLIALIISFTVAYNHAEKLKINPATGGLISLVVFVILSAKYENGAFDGTFLGSRGIFTAILVALLVIELYKFLLKLNLKFKLPESVAHTVQSSFEAIIPLAVILVVFYGLSVLVQTTTGQMIPALIQSAVAPALKASDSALFWFVLGILMSVFFWMGMHGWAVMSGVWLAATIAFTSANAEAAAAGQPMPYISGGTIWLCGQLHWHVPLMLMLFCKSERNKAIGKATLIPGIFALSEPYTFGVPVAFNPILAIPYIFAGPIANVLNFYAVKWGLMNRSANLIQILAPAPLQGFLGTNGDWRVFPIFLVLLAVEVVIWYPFLKVWDNKCLREEKEAVASAKTK
ncbi:MAG TPA: PTS transporter subunit EIIC [Anaerolineaceae bacterium]|nr:PTS transporter subunit EIIC [Anaerolineaceae bacterium]